MKICCPYLTHKDKTYNNLKVTNRTCTTHLCTGTINCNCVGCSGGCNGDTGGIEYPPGPGFPFPDRPYPPEGPGYTPEDEQEFEEIDARDRARKFQFIPARPATAGVCPNILQFEPQINPLPAGDVQIPSPPGLPQIPWGAINLPHTLNQPSQPNPPTAGNPAPVYSNAGIISDKFYEKRNSVPEKIIYYADLSTEANSPFNTIFLKNFNERGDKNDLHFKYKYALSSDKMKFYYPKINNFVNKIHTAMTANAQPVLSTFRDELVKFFLDIHLGDVDHPEFVFDYFSNFLTITGFVSNPPFEDYVKEIILNGKNAVPIVRDYFNQRIAAVTAENDHSTFVFHWARAGLPAEGLVTEALHNIVAFSQFTNTIFKLATSQFWAGVYAGTNTSINPANPPSWVPDPPIPAVPFPAPPNLLIGPVDFLAKGKEILDSVLSDDDKEKAFLNLAREFFRTLSPNTNSFSKLGGVTVDNNGNPLPANVQVRHLWIPIMIQNQPAYDQGNNSGTVFFDRVSTILSNPPAPVVEGAIDQILAGFTAASGLSTDSAFRVINFFIYNPDAYNAEWETFIGENVSGLPDDLNLNDLVIPQEDTFKFSTVDNPSDDPAANIAGDGSIVEIANDKLMVIPEKPTFLGFGLGFRRCPGEVFNYLIFISIVKRFANEEFFFKEDPVLCDTTDPERWIPVAARDVRRDNLFIKQPADFYNP